MAGGEEGRRWDTQGINRVHSEEDNVVADREYDGKGKEGDGEKLAPLEKTIHQKKKKVRFDDSAEPLEVRKSVGDRYHLRSRKKVDYYEGTDHS